MRQSLDNLLQKSVVLQYRLPCEVGSMIIPHTIITNGKDDCLRQMGSNSDIASLIYNGIVEYAYNDKEIDPTQLDNLQIRALCSKLKYNPTAPISNQLTYGFQGEVMLHLLLDHFYHANKCIARGYMFSALENAETKGYDSYMMLENDETIYWLFGEAKFYLPGYKSALKSIFEKINVALSDDYLHKNFLAFDNQYVNIAPNSRIPSIIDEWRANPLINMAVCALKYNMRLVYPMLILFDDKANSYDELIYEVVNYIQTNYEKIHPSLTIPYTLFFIFLPLDDSRAIKTQVLQWIKQQQPLMQ